MHKLTHSLDSAATRVRRHAENVVSALIWAALGAASAAFPIGVYVYSTGASA